MTSPFVAEHRFKSSPLVFMVTHEAGGKRFEAKVDCPHVSIEQGVVYSAISEVPFDACRQ